MAKPTDKSLIIRKSNNFIESRYKLSIYEQRLILFVASKISPDDKDFKSYEIRIAELVKMFGLEADKSIYEKVEQAATSLLTQLIRLQDSQTKELTTWFSYVKYIEGSGVVHLEFHSSLKSYLLQLKSHFTQYNLNYVIGFTSQYSIRFYELLKMDAFKAKNEKFEKSFEIDKLRLILGFEHNEYPFFSNFRDKVIEPAVKEINEKTDLNIEKVQYGKTGRKITNVTFTVIIRSKEEINQKQVQLNNESVKPEKNESHPIIERLIELGFSAELARTYKNKHGVKKIERNIAYTLAKKQEGVVKDIPAYLNKAIEADLGGSWDVKRSQDTDKKQQQEKKARENKAVEEKAKQETREKYRKAFERFQVLSEVEQQAIKNEFVETTDTTTIGLIKKLQTKNKDILDSPFVAAPFKKFLIEQKGF